jgi:hypothetical protein
VPELLDELGKVVGDLEAATNQSTVAKGLHVGARAGMQQAMADVLEVIRQLDGLNRFRRGRRGPQGLPATATTPPYRTVRATRKPTLSRRRYGNALTVPRAAERIMEAP